MTSINPIDYFKTVEMDAKYDFNKDGTVDAQDYSVGYMYITDDDETNDINFTTEQLDQAFATLLSSANLDIPETTPDKANERAAVIIDEIDSGKYNPNSVNTLNQLQEVGMQLSSYIKEAANIAKMLEGQIPVLQSQLDNLQKERDTKEKEYEKVAGEVKTLTANLQEEIASELEKVEVQAQARRKESDKIIADCIENYKNGEYPGEKLQDVIIRKLHTVGGWSTSKLEQYCATANNLISSKCEELENLVSDIRDVMQRFNDTTDLINLTKTNRSNVLQAANRASAQYQQGYTKRLELRKELVDAYKVDQTAGVDPYTSANAQVQSLANFLNNKELDNMPFADAIAVMFGYDYVENGQTVHVDGAFTGCGISYNKETGTLSVPIGHDPSAQNIYNALVIAFKENYGVDADRPDDIFDDPDDDPDDMQIGRTDPISFTKGNTTFDFIHDRDGDGTFDDASEFLGAEKGWEEMKLYDTDNDGVIKGDELKKLNMLALNNETGQYTFTNAAAAGVTSINLNDYQKVDQKQNNNDVLAGTFKLQVDGQTIEGKHTLDTQMNLQNKYATVYGSGIEDQTQNYELNPFMEDFNASVNTKQVVSQAEDSSAIAKTTIDRTKNQTDNKINREIVENVAVAKEEKKKEDKKTETANAENTASTESAEDKTTSSSKKKIV